MQYDDIQVDISRASAAAVGKRHGILPEELNALEERVLAAHAELAHERTAGQYGFYELHNNAAAFDRVRAEARRFGEKGYDNVVVLGIGGSALGTIALNTALNPPYYNLLGREARQGRPRLFVMDNIDPVTFAAMMALCPLETTVFNAISKSGETAETVTQLMIVIHALEQQLGKEAVKDHLVLTSNPKTGDAEKDQRNLFHPIAAEYGLSILEIPLNVGGRFSVFSPVGMFPAALLGMDLDGLRAGCAAMDVRCSQASLLENPAYLRAAVQYLLDTKKGKTMTVMMPYSDALRDVADWFRQLWAESLGKIRKHPETGKEEFVGQTPIKALGATDQHSQVQLFREGPNNKVFTIIEELEYQQTEAIPEALMFLPQVAYLRGKSMNQLMAAELQGTMDALKKSKRPVMRISLPRVNAYTVGQLMYMLEVETAMAGKLYGVNAFDQPGVEEGKKIARKLMGAKG